MDRHLDRLIDQESSDGKMDRQTFKQRVGFTDIQTERQIDIHSDRQMGEQTNR